MLKELLHKVFSISLALIVLCSTLSFTVEKHYCGSFLVDVALFNSVEKCGMDTVMNSNENEKSCCNDEIEVIQGQDELKALTFDDLNFEQQLFITVYTYSYINSFKGLENRTISFLEYPPPLIVRQLFKLDEAYLI
ncbi:hypothetical protein D7030_14450 [Flavobacteriaceae bacterium AU392]|nr:hypothetical protein D1817_04040 [Flavobacteriaceae bacterium]RKM81499.1 hypothetical protein D7030_14450 [Flavobacteriaceae bacterium AU392]